MANTSETPDANAVWYNNPRMSDVTIRYGKDGEKTFLGHRIILCSASEWFMKATENFKEATAPEITLTGDHPDGLEALFEYAYKKQYDETVEGSDQLGLLKQEFQHRLHVFATADKYQAKGLADAAFRHLKKSVDLFTQPRRTSNPEDATTAPEFFRFMLRQVYEKSEQYFPALRDNSQQSQQAERGTSLSASRSTKDATTAPEFLRFMLRQVYEKSEQYFLALRDDSQQSQRVERGTSLPTSRSTLPTTSSGTPSVSVVSQQHASTGGTTSNPPNPHSADGSSSNHPIDRLQNLLVEGAMTAWVNGHPDFNQKDLVPLTQIIPDFGTDLAAAALKSTHLRAMPEFSDEEDDWTSYYDSDSDIDNDSDW